MYRAFFRLVFARMDPELAHHLAIEMIGLAGKVPPARALVRVLLGRGLRPRSGPSSSIGVFPSGLEGTMGVAAGFDKNATAVLGILALGFSHVEVGTVTAVAQEGNPKPRSWRNIPEESLRNQMGFNNAGAARVARRLAALRRRRAGARAVIGVNIGKSRVTPLDQAPADYRTSARLLARHADYLVVNVSSPNTPGLRDLQAVDALRPILIAAREGADASMGEDPGARPTPLLVKIAPDLDDQDIEAIAALVSELGLDGIVAVNTTIDHDQGPGGLSGPPLLDRGLRVVANLRKALGPDKTIIGVGGISSAEDAHAYLDAGATMVQGFTAFIYQGPGWPGRINRALRMR